MSSDTTGRPVLSEELRSPEDGTCFFHLACHQVAPICHELDLDLVGLVGRILLVDQLLPLVVKQLSNPILSSTRVSMRSLAEVEVTCLLFSF